MDVRRTVAAVLAIATVTLALPVVASQAQAGPLGSTRIAMQPVPNHNALVPAIPRTDTPRIGNGEIWDIEVVGNRVFIAGSFTSLANKTGNTTRFNQRYLASYSIDTGLIDRTFRPSFDGAISAVEASPDGTKLFVGGTFHVVNGVPRSKVARLNLATGAPVSSFAFTGTTNNAVSALAATNSRLYVGGRFTRVNGQSRTGLAAVSTGTGAVDLTFDNQLSGGIGVGGMLTVKQLKLTHDETKLLVVHTGRKIDGEDRLGVGLIDTQTKQLLPWRTRLWDQYLPAVGGIQRIYAGDIAPDDQYFVVTSGSGGDRPPISDTAMAFPIAGGDFVEPLWVSRCFDSVYSVAITEEAVYVGGHFNWNESPTANQPWPGLDNVGYGTGQGLSGYGLGDQVVRRDHIGALDPATGTALQWNPGSDSFEGNKAMEATPQGLFVGGDGNTQGGINTGRVAFYDFITVPAPTKPDTTITAPIEGRVVPAGTQFSIQGKAKVPAGTDVQRVQVEVQQRGTSNYLQDDLTTWGSTNTINATLGALANGTRPWSLILTLTGTRNIQLRAKTFATNGTSDSTKALKTMEVFNFEDQTPSTSITGPGSPQASTTFTMTGTATDDHGVDALTYWFRDENSRYLQDDGSVAPIYNTFRGLPDVVGATSATWSYDVTLPHEGEWRGSATAIDTVGQSDLRGDTGDWTVSSSTSPPVVTIQQPVGMTPPASTPTVTVAPGSPMTFSGTSMDSDGLRSVEISLRNTSTRENLGGDGSWGVEVTADDYRISPQDISGQSYNWTYTTPFNLSPGMYSFSVRATDDVGLTTGSSNRGALTIAAQAPGDAFPNGTISSPGTGQPPLPNSQLNLTGTATDDKGVASVAVAIYDLDSGRYLQPNDTMTSDFATRDATLAAPNTTSTTWSLSLNLPSPGDFYAVAFASDNAGQLDPSTSGALGRYLYFPGDALPTFEATLGQPVDGSTFTEGRILASGRAEDDISIARVEVAIVDSVGRYMSSTGTFTSTTPSWRTAFLNSPGSPGSNFSYTSPVIPDGAYTVLVRPTDHHDQIGPVRAANGVTVTHPANNPPVADMDVSCDENVCSFDGRGSTDENPSALTYSWSFGTGQGTATGPLRTKTFTAAGTFVVVLTVKDEWNVTATTTRSVTIAEPAANAAPVPTFTTNCIELTCGVTSAGTADPDAGDVITYTWNWGDLTPNGAGPGSSHTFATTGTYTITLTATDGWGESASTTRTVTLEEPVGNQPPTVTFTPSCTGLVCQMNSNGTVDPDGNQIRYLWDWGDGTSTNTTAYPTHAYAAAGDYPITLTVTDGWNRSTTLTTTVTVSP